MTRVNSNQNKVIEPVASVVILTYNSEKYIEQTLDSIICQSTTFVFQVVISDDHSTDSTINILKSYEEQHESIKLVFNEKNVGIVTNFKRAIDNCTGKYIAFCGHDDYWHDDKKLQKQISFLEENDDFGLVHSDYNIYNEKTKKTIYNFHRSNKIQITHGWAADDLIYNYYINSCTPCFKKELFEKYVPISDFIELNFPVEDWATYIIISLHSKVGYIEDSTGTFRVGHESASNLSDYNKVEVYLEKHEVMFEYLRDRYKNQFDKFKKNDFKIYKSMNLLSTAYRLKTYVHANKHSRILETFEQKNKKIFFAKNIFLFYMYIWMRNLYFLIKK